ncbi:MAG: hypothetical protein ACXAD7_13225 [Candidatus Kariarchaeaceae archaeon]
MALFLTFQGHTFAISASNESPSYSFGHKMVYDSVNKKVILFGGARGEEDSIGYLRNDNTMVFNTNGKS